MRKVLMTMVAAAMMCGCEKAMESAPAVETAGGVADDTETREVTFRVKGDFRVEYSGAMRRAYLYDEDGMTDLWVFDYVGGECVQTIHQNVETAGDAWGKPVLYMKYGEHHVYFVAAAGEGPVLDEDDATIVWSKVKDTFWKDYEVTIGSTSNGDRSVTLDRVVTKLQVRATDEVPENCAMFSVTPSVWWSGIVYTSGAAMSSQATERSVTVPAAYRGTSGQLAMAIYGISDDEEWTANVTVKAKDSDGNIIGNAVISGAKFKRNRATMYSGCLFGEHGTATVELNNEWTEAMEGSW